MDKFPKRWNGMLNEEKTQLLIDLFNLSDLDSDGYLNKMEYVRFKILYFCSY